MDGRRVLATRGRPPPGRQSREGGGGGGGAVQGLRACQAAPRAPRQLAVPRQAVVRQLADLP
eukprot:1090449-Prorocentrum_minimum.AAC.2